MMTDENIGKLINNVPLVLSALALFWQQRSNATKASEERVKQSQKLDEIHTATDGNLTEVKAIKTALDKELSVAKERIAGLEAALGVAKAAAAVPPIKEGR